MKITKIMENDETVVVLEGNVDSSNAQEFEKELVTLTENESSFVIDAAKLEYISSAGLRVFLNIHKQMVSKNGKLSIRNCTPITKEIFALTGFDSIIDIK